MTRGTNSTEPPVIYDGICPHALACYVGCHLAMHDGDTVTCPMDAGRWVRVEHGKTRQGEEYIIILYGTGGEQCQSTMTDSKADSSTMKASES